MNSLRLGCAGFAILTPWQNQFRTLTLLSLAHLVYRDGLNRRSLLTVALTVALMFSQDAVRLHNLYTGLRPPSESPAGANAPSSALPAASSQNASHPSRHRDAAEATTSKPQRSSNLNDRRLSSSSTSDTRALDRDQTQHASHLDQLPSRPATTAAESRSARTQMHSSAAPGAGAASAAAAASGSGSPAPSPSSATAAATGVGGGGSGSGMVYMRFQVEGIKCEGCAARLKAALMAVSGVQRCAVDFASRQVRVWGYPGGAAPALTAAEVRATIQFVDLSYRATLVESQGLVS